MSNATDDKLRLLIERVERVNEEIADLNSDRSDIFAEAKGEGYDTKIMKDIIRYRKMNPDARQYWEDVFETYKLALGMGGIDDREERPRTRLGEAVEEYREHLADMDEQGIGVSMAVGDGPLLPLNETARAQQPQAAEG